MVSGEPMLDDGWGREGWEQPDKAGVRQHCQMAWVR